jgi:uncharacterized protein YqjF (DUF2071 family)
MVMNDFDYTALGERDHRPWPVPESPWVMTQTWHDLLFAHWPLEPASLRRVVPDVFPLDTFDGHAWIAVVPFRMTNVGPRLTPNLPGLSAFPELNVRTYVRVGDKPGVYFFSLDAGSSAAVAAARSLLRLPYYTADMTVENGDSAIRYRSRRTWGPSATLEARYQPTGPPVRQSVGSLEYFLTERYCLYAIDLFGHPYRLEIHHRPWPLQPAEADFPVNTMTQSIGIQLQGAPRLHFAKRLDVVCWLPRRI